MFTSVFSPKRFRPTLLLSGEAVYLLSWAALGRLFDIMISDAPR